jgi:hypothetical protein
MSTPAATSYDDSITSTPFAMPQNQPKSPKRLVFEPKQPISGPKQPNRRVSDSQQRVFEPQIPVRGRPYQAIYVGFFIDLI